MGDSNDYLREKKKIKLRRHIIENSGEEEPKPKRRFFGRAFFLILLLLIVGLFAGYKVFQYFRQYSEVVTLWAKPVTEGPETAYAQFGETVIKYGRDGVSGINHSGDEIWNQPFEMKEPVLSVSESYIVVADKLGYQFYICNETGCTGSVTTTKPISKVSISSHGFVAVVLEDTISNYTEFYNRDGKKWDMEIKAIINDKSGYPLAMDLSPDGTELVFSYVYLEQGSMLNQLLFYNFEVGKNVEDRMVGAFREYKESMIGAVTFLGNASACAFADSRVDFYDLTNALSPKLRVSHPYENEIKSVFYSENRAGVIEICKEGPAPYRMHIYDEKGNELFYKDIQIEYGNVEFSGNAILIYNENDCIIYNEKGILKYSGKLNGAITSLIWLKDNRYLQIGNQTIKELLLK